MKWWKEHCLLFPILSQLARKYLSIPATSAASERVFSKGGRIVTKLRSSLKEDNVSDLVILKGSWNHVEKWKIKKRKRESDNSTT